MSFWGSSNGWAPENVSNLLKESMLKWQVSLSKSLYIWTEKNSLSEGDLILAWANLGSLVEGSLKLFICIYLNDYLKSENIIKKRKQDISPEKLNLGDLVRLLEKEKLFVGHIEFIETIRKNRNTIHSFESNQIPDKAQFEIALKDYINLLISIDSQVPYPDGYGGISLQHLKTDTTYA